MKPTLKKSTLEELNKALEQYNYALKNQIKAMDYYKEVESRLPDNLKYMLSIKEQ